MKKNENVENVHKKQHELDDIRDALYKISHYLVEVYDNPSRGMQDVRENISYGFRNTFDFRTFLNEIVEQFVPRKFPYDGFKYDENEISITIAHKILHIDICITIPLLQYYSAANIRTMSHHDFLFAILVGLYGKYVIIARNFVLGKGNCEPTVVNPKEKYRVTEVTDLVAAAITMSTMGKPLDWCGYNKPSSHIFSALTALNIPLDREITGRIATLLMLVSGRDRISLSHVILDELQYLRHYIVDTTGECVETPSKLEDLEKFVSTLSYTLTKIDTYDN